MARVAVTGLGVLSPLGIGVEENTSRLFSGKSGIIPLEVQNQDSYRPMAGLIDQESLTFTHELLSEKEKVNLSPIATFALKASLEALNSGGYLENNFYDYPPLRRGSILGVGMPDMKMIRDGAIGWEKRGTRGVPVRTIPSSIPNVSTSLLAQKFDLRGVTYATSSACASSGHAIISSFMEIALGQHDVMITGGSFSSICPYGLSCFHTTGALYRGNLDHKRASRPFDKDRKGFVMSEGSGILVLENYEKAKKRGAKIYGEICGYGATSDGHHITAPNPEGTYQAEAMKRAIEMGNIRPFQIGHINAHATSTKLGDIAEIRGIKKAFGGHSKNIIVSSTKSSIGHTMNSAAAIELIYTLLSLEKQVSPPTINLDNQDPECDLNCSANTTVPYSAEFALSNSFGFGGTNTSFLLKTP